MSSFKSNMCCIKHLNYFIFGIMLHIFSHMSCCYSVLQLVMCGVTVSLKYDFYLCMYSIINGPSYIEYRKE